MGGGRRDKTEANIGEEKGPRARQRKGREEKKKRNTDERKIEGNRNNNKRNVNIK